MAPAAGTALERPRSMLCIAATEILPRRTRPVFAAAEPADAAFDFQGIGTHHRYVAGIGVAVVGIVDLAGPFVRTGGPHAAEQGNPDDPAFGEGRVFVLVVDLGFAGRGIDRIPEPHHD